MILERQLRQTLPVYGDGMQIRDWLYVDDHCEAIWQVATRGQVGETYCVGGDNRRPTSKLCAQSVRLWTNSSRVLFGRRTKN